MSVALQEMYKWQRGASAFWSVSCLPTGNVHANEHLVSFRPNFPLKSDTQTIKCGGGSNSASRSILSERPLPREYCGSRVNPREQTASFHILYSCCLDPARRPEQITFSVLCLKRFAARVLGLKNILFGWSHSRYRRG